MTDERRENYGRRATDSPAGPGDDPCVRRSELDAIITRAVRCALDQYEHTCIMCLRPDDVEHVRDLFSAIREIGHGDTEVGIKEIRENHKLMTRDRSWTGNAGTAIITAIILALMAVMGSTLVSGVVSWIRGLKP